ncbi:MAG TPA: hypothetical protein EYN91_09160 [Candidatus Melainabacteria bacterium]|jgi:hypothetical protein|nr:hypothetical protein [Candidatus Melainabacteria bacterium]HIN63549.1 hypothetical protein [Candidatus Obscuribacterales bacterium]
MNNKNDLLFRSALAALGIAGSIGAGFAQADTPFNHVDRTGDRILIAADNGCGKGSCGKDEKGADAAKKASKKKGKESSCKTAEGGKDASCSTHDKAAMGKGADKGK